MTASGVWAVVTTGATDPLLLRQRLPALVQRLGGVIAVGPRVSGLHGCRWTDADGTKTLGERLLSGARLLPAEAQVVVILDGQALDTVAPDDVAEMVGQLTEDACAVVRTAPVTDALKRVQGDRVLGSVDRDGLVTLQTPYVVRRDALLTAAADLDDVVGALVAAGRPVRVYPSTPTPVPVQR